MYASAAPAMALLQQVNGGRPLMQPTKLRPKKNITAMLTAIDLTGNGIIIHFAHCFVEKTHCHFDRSDAERR